MMTANTLPAQPIGIQSTAGAVPVRNEKEVHSIWIRKRKFSNKFSPGPLWTITLTRLFCLSMEKELLVIERLRDMTEEERRVELRLNTKLVTNKAVKGKYKFLQKYYHRVAFYLDKEKEVFKQVFSGAAMDDHFDKAVLPKVMQVKKFGRAELNIPIWSTKTQRNSTRRGAMREQRPGCLTSAAG